MITCQQWFDKWGGKAVDFDKFYGFQCMDLVEQYNAEVVGAPRIGGNAVDAWTRYPTAHYTRIANTPSGVPQKGDIMVWGTGIGTYGHIAIVVDANVNTFRSLDQNWPFSNGTTPSKVITHNYTSVLGWLRPKRDVNFDQAALDFIHAEQARKAQAEADRINAENAKKAAEEAKRLADEQAKLEKERLAKIEADRLAEEQRLADLKKADDERIEEERKKIEVVPVIEEKLTLLEAIKLLIEAIVNLFKRQ